MRSQERLPFPAEPADASAPIHYVLTARARRIVASESLPDLQLVTLHRRGGDGDADRGDPRPARARALRRSGRDPGQIAAALGVERELVVAWCQPVDAGRPGVARVVGGAVAEGPRHRPGRTWRMRGDDARVAADLAKRPARGGSAPAAEAIRRLDPEGPARSAAHAWLLGQVVGSAPSAASAGFVAGLAHTTAYAVSFQTTRAETAALVVRTIRDHAGLQCGRTRVVLQAGPAVSRDLAAHGWAAALELLPGQVRVVAWPEASGREAVRGIVRISDPRAAATVAGWRDALLAPCRRPSDEDGGASEGWSPPTAGTG